LASPIREILDTACGNYGAGFSRDTHELTQATRSPRSGLGCAKVTRLVEEPGFRNRDSGVRSPMEAGQG
jgi:hypothetical protein